MLETIFNPKSVAVIGASAKDFNIGNRIIKNLVDFGFIEMDLNPIIAYPDGVSVVDARISL